MTKEWAEFLTNLAWLGLWFSLIPVLIFIAYLVDLRFQAKPFELVEGSGKKGRTDPNSLRVIDRS